MRVFLTGGTGLIGSHLARELTTQGHEVVAMYRRDANTLFLEEHECDLTEGDVRDDSEILAKSMDGCSHVVHCAAMIYSGMKWPRVRAVNVDGTRNVLTAAVRVGVEHAVHVSTVAVYGTVEGVVDERSPTDSDLSREDLYARSKREAEEVARGIEEKRGLPVTIVRPSAVYGERDRLMTPALAEMLRLPLVPLLGPGTNTLPVVYAGNLAVAIRLALEAGVGQTTYLVGVDHPLKQRELLELLAAGMGVTPRFVRLPAMLVRGCGEILSRFGVGAPGARHLPINRLTRLALSDNPYSSRLIRRDLGWDPPYEHRAALERTGRWVSLRAPM
jgi:nucleoside-diphosphate-sugar epimerase